MTHTPLDTVETLLESVLAETEGEDVHYKLRTALQLVVVARDDHDRATATLSEADLDEDLRERLEDLGYIE